MKLLRIQRAVFAASEVVMIEADDNENPQIAIWVKNDNEVAYEFDYQTAEERDRDFLRLIADWNKALG